MVNLLHISPCSFPELSKEHATKKIWRELAKGFDEYHILARSYDNKFHDYKEDNIFLHLVPKLGRSKSFFFTSLRILKIISKFKIDLILSQCAIMGGFLAVFLSKYNKIPVMVEIHGMEYFRILDGKGFVNKILSSMIRYTFKNATKVRSLSEKMTEMLKERNIKANIVVIPNRVNIELFNMSKKDTTFGEKIKIVSVGRFVWEKAYDVAIKAVINLQKKYNVQLTLIGGGPLKDSYKQLANNYDYIILIDNLPQEEIVSFLNQSDIYIQPSISEGMPRTILEAMAIRLPIIVSDVGAVSGIVQNEINGLLIRPGNLKALENAIEKIIIDGKLREKIAAKGYNDAVTKYEWDNCFKKYRDEINNMISNK
ncbi:MAG: glycosyltransferase family 4 protein [Clostridia bacterium]|nr:glycosyltransferase family 4 protein [Clostridia bacterium]MDD4386496.1 glycosyltransferase family 4 protein [Clostridia bacterium]